MVPNKTLILTSLTVFSVTPLAQLCASDVPHQDPLPIILHDWNQRRHELNCVEWRFEGKRMWYQKSAAGSLHAATTSSNTVEGKLRITARFNFRENRFRRDAEVDSYYGGTDVLHNKSITVAQGATITTRILPGSVDLKTYGVDFVVHKGEPREMPTGDLDLHYWRPILWASGIVATKGQLVSASSFPGSNVASAFVFNGFDTIGGKTLAMISVDSSRTNATNYVRYWIDPEQHSAVVRAVAESGVEGVQMTGYQIDVEYSPHAQTWLPSRWVVRETLNHQTTVTETIEVAGVEVITEDNPALYLLEPEPNMRVYETDTQRDPSSREIIVSRRHYTMSATGQSNLVRATVHRYDTLLPHDRRNATLSRRRAVILTLMVGVCVPILLIMLKTFRRNRHP